MKHTHDLVINIAFFVFLIIMIYLNSSSLLTNNLDFSISILAITISLMLLLFENTTVLDIAHFLYCFVYLFSVTFLSKNQFLLALNILMISIVIFTRYYFNGCILNEKQKNTGFFVDLNSIIKKYIVFLNWDYIFPLLLVVSTIRLIKLRNITEIIIEAN